MPLISCRPFGTPSPSARRHASALGLAIALGLAAHSTPAGASDEIPGAPQRRPILISGATVHTVSGDRLTGADVLLDAGRIVAVGPKLSRPRDVERVDGAGLHLYPGLFHAGSSIGLVEIDAVRATRDFSETGEFNPNVRAASAVNPDSELIPVTRSNGVLLAVARPAGGVISGRGAVLQLDGWTSEDLTLRGDAGMFANWPRMAPVSQWAQGEDAAAQRKRLEESLQKLERFFVDARRHIDAQDADASVPHDLRFEALGPALRGDMPLIAEADDVQQIQAAVAFAERHGLRLVIQGGYDAPLCADLLKRSSVPVIVGGVHRLPLRRSDAYDAPFTLAERLRQAGVEYCISGDSRFGASGVRNLPYHAATAVAHGLSPEEALRAITLYPARIFGVDDRVGSIQPGRDATLFLADGDILETPTRVVQAWIQGRAVDLNDRHKRLWRKYQKKYE